MYCAVRWRPCRTLWSRRKFSNTHSPKQCNGAVSSPRYSSKIVSRRPRCLINDGSKSSVQVVIVARGFASSLVIRPDLHTPPTSRSVDYSARPTLRPQWLARVVAVFARSLSVRCPSIPRTPRCCPVRSTRRARSSYFVTRTMSHVRTVRRLPRSRLRSAIRAGVLWLPTPRACTPPITRFALDSTSLAWRRVTRECKPAIDPLPARGVLNY